MNATDVSRSSVCSLLHITVLAPAIQGGPWYMVRVVTEILDTMYHLRLKQTTMLLIFWPETLDIQNEFMSEPYNATKHH